MLFRAAALALICLASPLAAERDAASALHPVARSLPLDLAALDSPQAVTRSLRPKPRFDVLPPARWGATGRPALWTRAAVSALRGHADALPEMVPADITDWCPAYPEAPRADREAFWVGLVSALAKHESTYRPAVVGGGGRWYGLLQILPSTARGYGCKAGSGEALKHGPSNLACGLRIMARTVSRDGVVSRGMRGVAADWGPFHSRAKRDDMKSWIQAQSYCKPLISTRPKPRPRDFG
ncbi:transglycosylase SLT domain-containing protein [Roseivivax lentus]|nr:transglycosylase SLT domain-containing protein [Roseivivax lentus]